MSILTDDEVKVLPILISFSLVFTLISVFFFNELLDSTTKNELLESELDSLETKYANLKSERDSLKIRTEKTDPRTIWLARAVYSETNKRSEMKYVAWVIRNRVELNFRGDSTYSSVILASKEFSAFNRGKRFRFHYATKPYNHINKNTRNTGTWKDALEVSRNVIYSDTTERPFSKYTLFFYSEISMPSYKPHPEWTSKYERVGLRDVETKRFRFFKDPGYEYSPIPDSVGDGSDSVLTAR